MPGYNVPVRFQVNDKQFEDALKGATKALGELDAAYKDIKKEEKEKLKNEGALLTSSKNLLKEQVEYLARTKQIAPETKKIVNEYVKYKEALDRITKAEKALAAVQGKSATQQTQYAKLVNDAKNYENRLEAIRKELALTIAQNQNLGKSNAFKSLITGADDATIKTRSLNEILNDTSFKLFVLTFAAKQVFDTLLHGFVQVGEKVILFEQRVQALTGSTAAVKPLYEVINRLGVGIDDAASAFTRFAVANQTLGRTQDELVKMTETVLALGQVAGGSVQEVSSGLQQLGQGLASSRLQGDELRSVFENLPLVAKALADEIANGSIAQLRKMGAAGELTGKAVSDALLKAYDSAKKLAEGLPDTTEKAINRLSNAWDLFIAQLLKSVGGTSSVTTTFNNIAETINKFTNTVERNSETVKDALQGLGFAFTAFFGIFIGQRFVTIGVEITKLATDFAAAKTAAAAFSLALSPALAGGLAIVAGLVYAFTKSLKDSRLETDAAKESLDAYLQSVKDKTAGELAADVDDLTAAYLAQVEVVKQDVAEVRKYEDYLANGGRGSAAKIDMTDKLTKAVHQHQKTLALDSKALAEQGEKLRASAKAQDENAKSIGNATAKTAEQTKALDDLDKLLGRIDKRTHVLNDYAKGITTIFSAIKAGASGDEIQSALDLLNKFKDEGLAAYDKKAQKYFDPSQLDAYVEAVINAAQTTDVGAGRITGAIDAVRTSFKKSAVEIKKYAEDFKIPESVVLSYYTMESSLGAFTEGNKKASGPMQITAGTAKTIATAFNAANKEMIKADDVLHDIPTNIKAGIFWQSKLIESNDHLYQSWIEYFAGINNYSGTIDKLGPKTQEYVKGQLKLVTAISKTTGEYKKLRPELDLAQKFITNTLPEQVRAQHEAARAQKEVTNEQNASAKAYEEGKRKIEEHIEALKADEKAASLSKEQQAALAEQIYFTNLIQETELKQKQAARKGNDKLAESYERLIKDYKKLQPEAIKVAAAAAKAKDSAKSLSLQIDEIIKTLNKNIQNELAKTFEDIFSSGFKSASKFFDDLFDLFKKTLAQIAAAALQSQIIVPYILQPLGVSGGVAPSASGVSGATSTLGSTVSPSGISNLFGGTNVGSGLASGAEFINTKIIGNSIGEGFLGTVSAGLKTVPNFAFGIGSLAGGVLGSYLGADSVTATIGSSIGSAAGAALGSYFGGAGGAAVGAAVGTGILPVVGTIVGGLIGGAASSLFGGSSKKVPSATIQYQRGEFDYADAAHLDSTTFYQIQDAIDTTNKTIDEIAQLVDVQRREFDSQSKVKKFTNLDDIASYLEEEALGAIWDTIRDQRTTESKFLIDEVYKKQDIQTVDQLYAALKQAIAYFDNFKKAIKDLIDTPAGKVLGLTKDLDKDFDKLMRYADLYAKSGEDAGATINRLVIEIGALSTAAELTSTKLSGSADKTVKLADKLSESAGGVDALAAQLQNYYDLFFTEEEKTAQKVKDATNIINDATKNLNITLPETRAEFKNYIESLDLTKNSQREVFSTLMKLTSQFDVLYSASEKAADSVADVSAALDETVQTVDAVADALKTLKEYLTPDTSDAQALQDFTTIFNEWIGSMPQSKAALLDLVNSEAFTDSQLVYLSEHTEALGKAFDALAQAEADVQNAIGTLQSALEVAPTGAEALNEYVQLTQDILGETPSTKDALLALVNSGELANDQLLALASNVDTITAAFEYAAQQATDAVNAEYDSKVQAINDGYNAEVQAVNDGYNDLVKAVNDGYNTQVDAINSQYDAQVKAINENSDNIRKAYQDQLDAVNDFISELNSIVSSVTSAAASFGDTRQEITDINFERAKQQLSNYANADTLPSADELNKTLSALQDNNSSNYATLEEEVVANSRIRADLEKIQVKADEELKRQEAQQAAIEAAIEQTAENTSQQLEVLADSRDQQLAALSANRDAQLDALKASTDAQLQALEDANNEQLAAADAWKAQQLALLQGQIDAVNAQTTIIEAAAVENGAVGGTASITNTPVLTITQTDTDNKVWDKLDNIYNELVAFNSKTDKSDKDTASFRTDLYQSTRNVEDILDTWSRNGVPLETEDEDGEYVLALSGT